MEQVKKIHAGREDNARLAPIVAILEKYCPEEISTLEMDLELREQGIYNVALSSSISDLRKLGYPVSRAKFSHVTGDGKKVYMYRKEVV